MSNHTIRADDALWTAATVKARMNSMTMTAIVTSALRDYIDGDWNPPRDMPVGWSEFEALEARVAALEEDRTTGHVTIRRKEEDAGQLQPAQGS